MNDLSHFRSIMEYVNIANHVELVNYWIGLALNLLLLYSILFATRLGIGVYKYLQMIFVLNNIAYGTYSYWMEVYFNCLFGAMFSLILVVISLNFLYRYWAVTNTTLILLFSTFRFNLVLALIASVEFMVWYAACLFLFEATEGARVDLAPDLCFNVMVTTMQSRLRVFASSLAKSALDSHILTVSILRHLARGKVISEKTKKLQYALFRSLAVQTVVPLLFVHADASHCLLLPVFGVDVSFMNDWISMIVSFFPPFDAFATIILMHDYREYVWSAASCRWLRFRSTKESSAVHPASLQNTH